MIDNDMQVIINDFKEFKLTSIVGAYEHGDITEEQYLEAEAELLLLANYAGKMKDALEELQELTEIQKKDGSADVNEYMRGMANGMILAVSIMTDIDPEFMEAK